VFDSFDSNAKLGQVLAAYIYWQSYFTNVLPPGQNGVVCVLENTCGQAFTYVLHGPDAKYIGPGDLHESKYNDWMVETGYGAFLGKDAIPATTGTTTSGNDAQCFYNVKVYPSTEMSEDYLTWSPLIFAGGMVAVFLFTALILGLYDRMVSVRHKTVETKAIKSTAVVQSLFPEKVRERLYEEGPSKDSKSGTSAFRSGRTPTLTDNMENLVDDNMPIADLYPECTVLFADICGFTKWYVVYRFFVVCELSTNALHLTSYRCYLFFLSGVLSIHPPKSLNCSKPCIPPLIRSQSDVKYSRSRPLEM
jgi:hypothetical protein